MMMKIINLIAFMWIMFISKAFAGDGRFQLITHPQFPNKAQVLLDTATGKMWDRQCITLASNGDCAYHAWMTIDTEGITKSTDKIYELSKFMKKSADEEIKDKAPK